MSIEKSKFENEKEYLVNNLVNSFEKYKSTINDEFEKLDRKHSRTSFNRITSFPISLKEDESRTKEQELQLSINHFNINSVLTDMEFLEESKNSFGKSYIEYKEAIEDLEHFNLITKSPSKEQKKIKKLKRTLNDITTGYSDKADLKPLIELKDSYKNIKKYKEFGDISYLNFLLKFNQDGEIQLDNEGYYEINDYYFIDNLSRLKYNLKKKYLINIKQINKITKRHSSKDRLKRYLIFG